MVRVGCSQEGYYVSRMLFVLLYRFLCAFNFMVGMLVGAGKHGRTFFEKPKVIE